jgi:hypothetical protein
MPRPARNSIHMSRLVLRMRAVSRVLVICASVPSLGLLKQIAHESIVTTVLQRVRYSSQMVGKWTSKHDLCIHSESYV